MFTFLFFGFAYILRLCILDSGHQIDTDSLFVFVLIWTKCCAYLVFGTLAFSKAWINWRGDVNQMLLLKLLDAQQKEKNSDVTTG